MVVTLIFLSGDWIVADVCGILLLVLIQIMRGIFQASVWKIKKHSQIWISPLFWKPFNESWHNLKSIESVSVPADSRSYSSLMYRQWVKACAQTWASNCQRKPRVIFSLLLSLFLFLKWVVDMSWENHYSLSTASSSTSAISSPAVPLPGFSWKMGPPGQAGKSIKWWGAGFQVEKPSSSTNTWTYLFTITLCAPPQALHVLLQSPDNPAQGNLITVLIEILSCTPDAPQGNLGCVVCFLLQVSSAQSSVGHCQCCSLFVLCFNPTNPVFSWMY